MDYVIFETTYQRGNLFLCSTKTKKEQSMEYSIHAFAVTGVYILYIAGVMMHDLFHKKGKKEDGAEEFDTAGMSGGDEDKPAVIDETEDGFALHHNNKVEEEQSGSESDNTADSQDSDEPEVEQTEQPVDDNAEDDAVLEDESESSMSAYERAKAVQRECMATAPMTYQEQYNSEAFAVKMSQPIRDEERLLINVLNRK